VLVELDAFVVSAPTPAGGAPLSRSTIFPIHALLTTAGGANLWSRWFSSPAVLPRRRAQPDLPTLQAMYEAQQPAAWVWRWPCRWPAGGCWPKRRLVRRLNARHACRPAISRRPCRAPRRACTAHEAFVDWLKTETAASATVSTARHQPTSDYA
jgi:hypothetical protein